MTLTSAPAPYESALPSQLSSSSSSSSCYDQAVSDSYRNKHTYQAQPVTPASYYKVPSSSVPQASASSDCYGPSEYYVPYGMAYGPGTVGYDLHCQGVWSQSAGPATSTSTLMPYNTAMPWRNVACGAEWHAPVASSSTTAFSTQPNVNMFAPGLTNPSGPAKLPKYETSDPLLDKFPASRMQPADPLNWITKEILETKSAEEAFHHQRKPLVQLKSEAVRQAQAAAIMANAAAHLSHL